MQQQQNALFLENLTDRDPQVQKQSLIFLYRDQKKIPAPLIVNLCQRCVDQLVEIDKSDSQKVAFMRGFLYGLEAFKRDVSWGAQGLLIGWRNRIHEAGFVGLVGYIDDSLNLLRHLSLDYLKSLGNVKSIYLIRHGESTGNAQAKLIGSHWW